MPSTLQEGVLITCDAPIKQFILHLDEELSRESGANSILIEKDLDDTHVLVRAESVDMIQRKIDAMMSSNAFSRGVEAKDLEPDDPDVPSAPAPAKRKR